ncbi:GTP cyclohydrolase II [uncultured Lutibacter sp.]|uniref:GTP cyclohydrolase II n=1 Tax=uncultured Lutibacter sp. TaxID=437739 RepID=UPI002625D927|nr:GTP cyclohydrolase II [uncultured Lutibacter sp.]
MNQKNSTITQGETIQLPTKYGHFKLIPFQENLNGVEHIALIKGDFKLNEIVFTRIHSACATGDLFGSLKCDCGEQLIEAMKMIETIGKGVIVYLQQEGRGIGLMNKVKAYKLQEQGFDTLEANLHLGFAADERNYKIGAEILIAIGVNKVKLITNNPEKINGLEQYGVEVVNRIPLLIKSNKFNKDYLNTKEIRMGHLLNEEEQEYQCYDN